MKELWTRDIYTDLKDVEFSNVVSIDPYKCYECASVKIVHESFLHVPEWVRGYDLLKNYVAGTPLHIRWREMLSRSCDWTRSEAKFIKLIRNRNVDIFC